MLKQDLIFRNPLRFMGNGSDDILPPGGFGAILARAGLGKTAILIQLALDGLMRNKNILHISLEDPVKKVCLWYEEVFRNIARQHEVQQADTLWESILPHRLIMTFKVDGFSVPKLEERLADLTEQNIFVPQMMLIDGLPFDDTVKASLTSLKSLAKENAMNIWFAVRTHRHEPPGPDGIPVPLVNIADLFDTAFQLQPEGKKIHVMPIKTGAPDTDRRPLVLDPSTMLVVED